MSPAEIGSSDLLTDDVQCWVVSDAMKQLSVRKIILSNDEGRIA